MPTTRPLERRPPAPVHRQQAEQVLDLVQRWSIPPTTARRPPGRPRRSEASVAKVGAARCASGNSGPPVSSSGRTAAATQQAIAVGSRLRGRSSNSSSSTASSTAATGVPNTAVIPATAPATSKVLRSPPVMREELARERAQRAARHDDRALSPERAAAADRDARGNRLQHRHLGRHPALVEQDRFNRLRNAVSTDLLGAVACHQTDDHAADHGHRDLGQPQCVGRPARPARSDRIWKKNRLVKKTDQVQQRPGAAQCADRRRPRRRSRRWRGRRPRGRRSRVAHIVLAQRVARRPEAVWIGPCGFLLAR